MKKDTKAKGFSLRGVFNGRKRSLARNSPAENPARFPKRLGPEESDSDSVISSELMRIVRLLELRTRLKVRDVFGGRYHSIFKGQGMEFSTVREYVPGDDIRNIDWNVTARMNAPYVKIFEEERELTVMILVDLSASSDFGTQKQLKRDIAAELTALLALCSQNNKDKVGLILFTDEVEHVVPPKKGQHHVSRLIRDVLAFQPSNTGTSISNSLEYTLRMLRKKSVIFLISDFEDEGYEQAIKIANRKHDLIAIELYDPRERSIPDVGLVQLKDSESGEVVWVDASSAAFRKKFVLEASRKATGRENFFKSVDVDRIELSIDEPYQMSLIKFFRMRERRR